ncbi:MAG: SufE family protein [Chloroflexi bacterium]|jgi:cysteine desulfuration protein SufE|nr:SufE family protein [Chloroflexota bacterium]
MTEKATIKEIEQELIDDFNLLDNWEEKYEYLIELGQDMPRMDPTLKTDDRLVQGCQSSVWFDIHCQEGRLLFSADSDSVVVKGMVAVLNQTLNGQPAEDVLQANLDFFETLGLWRHISSQRSNGLTAMVGHLKQAAAECLDK